MPSEPYIIHGRWTNVAGSAVANTTIYLKNENSGNTIPTITDTNGDYIFDCANFIPDYADGDVLSLFSEEGEFEYYVSHNGGLSWYQVDNEESYSFDVNSLKVKIDNTNYPGGRDIIVVYPT